MVPRWPDAPPLPLQHSLHVRCTATTAPHSTRCTGAQVLPLIGDAQKQTMGASLKERQRFKSAGKDLETISKTCAALPTKTVCEL